jgi:hypothetical protein
MLTFARRTLQVAAGLALIACLESCGPGCLDNMAGVTCTPPSVGPSPTPTPVCIQTALYTDSGGIQSRALLVHEFPLTESGRLDMTLDWTNAGSMMGMYLVPAGTCTLDEFNNRTCNFIVRSEPPGAKPRKVSTTGSLQPGNYRFMVANFSAATESAAVQVVLSKGSCAALSSAPTSASAFEGRHTPTIESVVSR